ncbi:MAG: hypothetical protein KKA90_03505 [Nanoarchaeota archaeon]|nr:hypothetical protein [Nanoarchaeota archaeon]
MKRADLVLLGVIVIAVAVGAVLLQPPVRGTYQVDATGLLSYQHRPTPNATETPASATSSHLVIDSRPSPAFGLLTLPEEGEPPYPVFIVLPGAGVTKEGEQHGLSADLNSLGFATLTLDIRGQGESTSPILDFQSDFEQFSSGQEATHHQQVYDILRAYDFLQADDQFSTISVAGESAGARYGIIAAAIEPGIHGVIGISTGGYTAANLSAKELQYLNSINPLFYAPLVSPRPVVLLHSTNDSIVPYEDAQALFAAAGEPKQFFPFDKPGHGYDPLEKEMLATVLADW